MKASLRISVAALQIVMVWAYTCRADSPIAPEFTTAKVTAEQLQAYTAQVEAMTDIQCHDIGANQRQCSSDSQMTIWTFTRPGHPAHPAVTRGILRVSPPYVGIDRSGVYAGDDGAFANWIKEWVAVDVHNVAEFKKHLPQ
jgi:hypothetical protein